MFIFQVQVKRSVQGGEPSSSEDDEHSQSVKNCAPPILRKGKLVIVDLAGSERVHKSGKSMFTNMFRCLSYMQNVIVLF